MHRPQSESGYRFSIRRKIWLSLSLLPFGYSATMLFGYVRGLETRARLSAIAEQEFPAAIESQTALTAFKEQIQHYGDAVTLGEEDAIREADESAARTQEALHRLSLHMTEDRVRYPQAVELIGRLASFTREARPTYECLACGQTDEGLEAKAGKLAARYTQLEADLEAFDTALASGLKNGLHAVSLATERQWYTNFWIFLIVVLSAACLVSTIIHRWITAPLRQTAEFARTMAAGNLSQKLDIDQDDEIGALARAINIMAGEIEKSQEGLEAQVSERTAQLKRTHQELVITARKAGMADVASAVLHNVGNVLNSVNVTTDSLRARSRESKVGSLLRASRLLEQHSDCLASYLQDDPQGRKLIPYLVSLATHLDQEREKRLEMLDSLHDHVEHITAIVSRQQSNSRSGDLLEALSLADLVNEAVGLTSSGRPRDRVVLELAVPSDLPPALVDRHKTLEILVNLLTNARQAVEMGEAEDMVVRVEIELVDTEGLVVRVIDNGVGITEEHMRSLFTHGFTTKPNGHGFGLHSACLAARSQGGELSASSPGRGLGATFVLRVPIANMETANA